MKYQNIYTFGDPLSNDLLIQMIDDHDLELIEREISYIRELVQGRQFCLKAVKVNSWNNDLSPWPAPPVFGSEPFGNGASDTLSFLLEEPVHSVFPERNDSKRIYIGGYSLAGLFALWAAYQTDVFDGVAAASPSVWFPGFLDYMRSTPCRTRAVYLSIGNKEERTKNPVMSQVGNAIREGYSLLQKVHCDCILEWNKGNHFKEPELRTAKAFAWVMNTLHP